jgi:hypothetical protein
MLLTVPFVSHNGQYFRLRGVRKSSDTLLDHFLLRGINDALFLSVFLFVSSVHFSPPLILSFCSAYEENVRLADDWSRLFL